MVSAMRSIRFPIPGAVVLKELARDLAKEKGRSEEFAFLELLEERAIECFAKHKGLETGFLERGLLFWNSFMR